MVFGEKIETSIDMQKEELDAVKKGFKTEFGEFNAEISNQDKGVAEKLPQDQVDNISTFCDEYIDDQDSFVVRARADGFGISESGSLERKNNAQKLASNLKIKGLDIDPDISTGNTAQAWIRAMTLLNQLPQDTLDIVKNKIEFDVKPVKEKDEQGTYRFAALDIKRGTTIIPDIQKGEYENPADLDNSSIEEIDLNIPYKETDIPDKEKNKFSSWDALQKPLSVPIVAKIGKQYYIKYTFYKWENGKLLTASNNWKKTSKERFNDRIGRKGLKANSISLNLSEEFSKYEKDFGKIPKLNKRLSYLNSLVEGNPKYALNKLYQNQEQRKGSDKYVARARENEVQNSQKLLALNN